MFKRKIVAMWLPDLLYCGAVPGELIIQAAKPEIGRLMHFGSRLLPTCGNCKK
jgi:hypothetical protein